MCFVQTRTTDEVRSIKGKESCMKKSNYDYTKLTLKPKHKSESISSYEYWAKVKKVVDGDTLDLEISLGFDTSVAKRVRLIGIDTPEVWGVKHRKPRFRKSN